MLQKIKPVHIITIGLGVDMLMHGLVRIPHLAAFVNKSTGSMAGTFLSESLVHLFLTALPFIEAIIGVLILMMGRIGRLGLIGGGLLMTVLLFGTTSHQDWVGAGQQVVYLIAFTIALYLHDTADTNIINKQDIR